MQTVIPDRLFVSLSEQRDNVRNEETCNSKIYHSPNRLRPIPWPRPPAWRLPTVESECRIIIQIFKLVFQTQFKLNIFSSQKFGHFVLGLFERLLQHYPRQIPYLGCKHYGDNPVSLAAPELQSQLLLKEVNQRSKTKDQSMIDTHHRVIWW